MALDFHRLDNRQYLQGLDDFKFNSLSEIFNLYKIRTGILIEQYRDTILIVENQLVLIKLIDSYLENEKLSLDKNKKLVIEDFRDFLITSTNNNWNLKIVGD